MKTKTSDIPPAGTEPREAFLAASMKIDAALPPAEGQPPRNRRFSMLAYTGGPMRVANFSYPVVVDLAGLDVSGASFPVFIGHNQDPEYMLGQADRVEIVGTNLVSSGDVIDVSLRAQQVVAAADRGFRWQASIGAVVLQREFVPEGKSVNVNGGNFAGPVIVARKSELGEISFVFRGADRNTSASIAASAAQENTMPETTEAVTQEPSAQTVQASAQTTVVAADPAKAMREAAAAESRRIAAIRKVCGGKHDEIEAKAIEEVWEPTQAELEVLRAERPKARNMHADGGGMDRNVILATACMAAKLDDKRLVADFGEQAVNAAYRMRGIGIQDFFRLIARSEGRELPLMTQKGTEFIEAAFSTLSLPGILSNVANKILLEGYNYVESAWRQVCRVGSLNDFKPHSRFRLTDGMKFEKVGPDGQLKHGSLGEQAYTLQADTSGIMFSLTRKMIVNDDLSAFADIPRQLGMNAADAISEAVWTLVLSNPGDFFSTGNKNYLTGADTALTFDGLSAAYTAFLNQTKPNGRPLGLEPRILLVPTTLRVPADQLTSSRQLIAAIATTGSKSTVVPQDNTMAGKFQVVSSAYLGNATFPGYSTKAWYLLADPNVLPIMEVGFLNGMEQPTVERAEADFSTLGVQFRGFIDFGVGMQDPRGALKSKGEA